MIFRRTLSLLAGLLSLGTPIAADEAAIAAIDAWLQEHRPAYVAQLLPGVSAAEFDAMIGTDFKSPDWWRRSWLPFTAGYGGDAYVVVADGTGPGGPVIGFWNDDPSRHKNAATLAVWLTELAASMTSGSYEVDGETFGAN